MTYTIEQDFDLTKGAKYKRRRYDFPQALRIGAGFVVAWPEGERSPVLAKLIQRSLHSFYAATRGYRIGTASTEEGIRVKRLK